jgi:hypothetical protein
MMAEASQNEKRDLRREKYQTKVLFLCIKSAKHDIKKYDIRI